MPNSMSGGIFLNCLIYFILLFSEAPQFIQNWSQKLEEKYIGQESGVQTYYDNFINV